MAYKTVKFGDHRERRSFSTKRSTLELSNLLEVQKDSFDLFLKEGIKEGMKAGKAKGETEMRCKIACNLKKTGLPLDVIIQTTGLTAKEIDEL